MEKRFVRYFLPGILRWRLPILRFPRMFFGRPEPVNVDEIITDDEIEWPEQEYYLFISLIKRVMHLLFRLIRAILIIVR